jgi:hypothetical protein
MKRPLRKIIDYLVLVLIVSSSIIFILLLSGNRMYQILTIVGMSIFYILWGIFHHIREGTYYPRVALEYIIYSLLGCALSIGLLI